MGPAKNTVEPPFTWSRNLMLFAVFCFVLHELRSQMNTGWSPCHKWKPLQYYFHNSTPMSIAWTITVAFLSLPSPVISLSLHSHDSSFSLSTSTTAPSLSLHGHGSPDINRGRLQLQPSDLTPDHHIASFSTPPPREKPSRPPLPVTSSRWPYHNSWPCYCSHVTWTCEQ